MKLKVGDLVYLENVGFPYDNTKNGAESWEGVSCRVAELATGHGKNYVKVCPIIPLRTERGDTMNCALFHPSSVKHENRPWLKKHLQDVIKLKKKLREVVELADEISLVD